MSNTTDRLSQLEKNFQNHGHYKFDWGIAMIPHPDKAYKGGEDACHAENNIIAVADGVGGWAEHGVDPGLYSKKLCQLIKNLVTSGSRQDYLNQPEKIIVDSVRENLETGTSTVLVLALNAITGLLKAAYLGDSIFHIFRKKSKQSSLCLHYAAQQQQKSFNFPFQVGTHGDSPLLSVKYEQQVEVGDVIVAGSDGLWDNLHDHELLSIVNSQKDMKKLAGKIAQEAYKNSLMKGYASPFYQKALEAKRRFPMMGKSDDITVVAAQIAYEK